jgi:hypothetical protein
MVSERLQLIIETLGGAKAAAELEKIGTTGKAEFDKAATAGTKAANDIASAQARVAAASEAGSAKVVAASQRLEVAQLRAAQFSAAVERAQAKVGESAAGTLAAAKAAEALEAAELRAAHAGAAVEAAQAKVAATTVAANQAMSGAKAELAAVEAATAKLSGTTGIADAALSKLGVTGAGMGDALGTGVKAAAGAAAVAIAALAVKGVRDFADLAEEVDSVQDVMGGTAEEASKLLYAAKALGVGVETLAGGAFKLTLNLEKNKSALAAYGVEAVLAKDGTVDTYATLIRLSDAFNRLTDPVEKNRLLMLAFGKGGRELEEILSAGGSRLREFAKDAERAGLVLDDAGVKKGKQFNIAMEQAGLSVKGLTISLGSGLIGSLSQAATGMSFLTDKANSLIKPIGGVAGVVEATAKAMFPAVQVFSLFGGKAKDAGDAASDATPEVRGLGDAAAEGAPGVGLMAGSADLLKDALDPLPHELKTTGSSAGDMATDLERARDAAGDLTDKLDKLLGGTISVEDATSDYEQALDDLAGKLTENGTSLDLSTEKGRENSAAVRELVGRVRDHIQALINNGATQDQVRSQFNAHIEDFRRVLTQMGLNEQEIDALITKYCLVPESVETAVELTGVEQAIADTDRVVNHLVERFGIAQQAAEISVQVFGLDQAESRLAQLRADSYDIVGPVSSAPASADQDGVEGYLSPDEAGSATGNILGPRGIVPLAGGGRTPGFKTNGPRFLVGEGNRAFPEYVIATDPAHRVRNEKLWKSAGRDLHLMAEGGIIDQSEYDSWKASQPNGTPYSVFEANALADPHRGQPGWVEDYDGRWIPEGSPAHPVPLGNQTGIWQTEMNAAGQHENIYYPPGMSPTQPAVNQTRILSAGPASSGRPAPPRSSGSGSSSGSTAADLVRVLAELAGILEALRRDPIHATVSAYDVARGLSEARPR